MIDEKEIVKWGRYNRKLAKSLNNYIMSRIQLMESDDYAVKYKLMNELKAELDKSAVITRQIPTQYVPLKPVYDKLYELLFKHSAFRKSYIELLELWNEEKSKKFGDHGKIEKKLEKLEKKVAAILEKNAYEIELDKSLIPKRLRSKVNSAFRKIISAAMPNLKISFSSVVYGFIGMCMLLNIAGTAIAEVSNQAFVSNSAKIERIFRLAKETGMRFSKNWEYIYYDDEMHPIKYTADKETRKMINMDLSTLNDWLKETRLIDPELWHYLLTAPFRDAVTILKSKIQQRLDDYAPGQYSVKADIRSSKRKASEITRYKKIGGEVTYEEWKPISLTTLVVSLNQEYAKSLMKSSEIVKTKIKGMKIIKMISCELDSNGNLVFSIIFDNSMWEYMAGEINDPYNETYMANLIIIPNKTTN